MRHRDADHHGNGTSGGNNNPPVANTDIATTLQNTPVTLNTLTNDAAGNAGGTLNPASVAIVAGTQPNPSTQGTLSVNSTTGAITFTPVAGFTGVVTYSYQVCDNSTTPL
ncbi:MAG: Ig-like domain-containing protein, partial [Rhizobium sp.]|nr:Ig-like domain-containing protein [Rhizobium sp.]